MSRMLPIEYGGWNGGGEKRKKDCSEQNEFEFNQCQIKLH